MDASSCRCRWMDDVQNAAIGFLIGLIILLSFAAINPKREEPLLQRSINESMEWVVVLDSDTVYNIPPAKRPLTADGWAEMMATHRLDRREDVDAFRKATGDTRVIFIAKSGGNRTIEIDCGQTPFMRTEERDDLTWRHCVGRNKGRWHEGRCEIDTFLDLISVDVDELTCTFRWRTLPSRSPAKIETLLRDKPAFEVHSSVAIDPNPLDKARILSSVAFLLSMMGMSITLGGMMRSARKLRGDVKHPLLPN